MPKILILLAFIFCFISQKSSAQGRVWILSTDTLKYPIKLGDGESTMGWIDRYDTLSCKIKINGSDEIKAAYKVVFIYNGHQIDNPITINLFLDDKKNKIKNVHSYILTSE